MPTVCLIVGELERRRAGGMLGLQDHRDQPDDAAFAAGDVEPR